MGARWSGLAAACGLLISACGPAAPASAPGQSGGPTAVTSVATTPAASPTATPPPAVTLRFDFDADAVLTPALAGTADVFVNPGAVIESGDTLHMFPNLFSEWPGRVRIPHMTSTDGRAWVLDTEAAPIDSADLSMADPGIDVSTGYLADDGTWVLYFTTVQRAAPWDIWRATAPTPRGPWTTSELPVVAHGTGTAFDSRGVTWPSVVRFGDRWAMYYAGLSGTGRGTGAIGVAFSDDGITWTKAAEPVLVATERWEFRSVDRPRVVATPSGLVMLYAGLELTSRGLATSSDGVTWTRVPGPNIERSDFPLSGGAWDAALLHRNGLLEYFLEIGASSTQVYRATLAWP